MQETSNDATGDAWRSDYFVITPENAGSFDTRLIGYSVTKSHEVVTGADKWRGRLEPEGCWVLIERDGGKLTVTQDFLGCWGLYLYRDGDWWALSNSFLHLVEFLQGEHPLTFDKPYADQFIALALVSLCMKRTMVREIELLDRAAIVDIDIATGEIGTSCRDYEENTIALDSPEGIATLDAWHDKWVRVIQAVLKKGDVRCDVSGGFDSRTVLGLFMDPRVDRESAKFATRENKRAISSGDLKTVRELAETAGIELIPANQHATKPRRRALRKNIDMMLCVKGFSHHHMGGGSKERFAEPVYCFKGCGGETLRAYWGDGTAEGPHAFIDELSQHARWLYASDGEDIEKSMRATLEESLADIEAKFSALGREIAPADLLGNLYRETRCRKHFGNNIHAKWNQNIVTMAPLLDHDLHRLILKTRDCDDDNLLMALFFTRYAPHFLDVGFQGGRSIDRATIEAARELNRRFPLDGAGEGAGAAGGTESAGAAGGAGTANAASEGAGIGAAAAGGAREHEKGRHLHTAYLMRSLHVMQPLDQADRKKSSTVFYNTAQSPHVVEQFLELYAPQTYQALIERSTYKNLCTYSAAPIIDSIAWLHEACTAPGKIAPLTDYIIENSTVPPETSGDAAPLPVLSELADHSMTALIRLRHIGTDDEQAIESLHIEEVEGVDIDIVPIIRKKHASIFVRSATGRARLAVSLEGGGRIEVALGTEKMLDADGKLIRHWIDYTRVEANGETLLADRQRARANRRIVFKLDVADGETVNLEIEWQRHDKGAGDGAEG